MSRYYDTLPPPPLGRYWLIGALFLVLLPQLSRLPLWLSSGCAILIIWRVMHELRGWPLPGRGVRMMLALLGLGSVLIVFHSIIGRDAGVALLAVMLSLKLLEIHTSRDAMIALFIGYFLVISGFLFSQSLFMGAYLFAVVLLLTTALTALNHHGDHRDTHRQYLRIGGALLLQSLPLMAIMFILFPRFSSPLWDIPEPSDVARTGLSDSIQLGSIARLAESDEVAFRVHFDGAIPAADKLYWRGPVLLQTDGSNWQRATLPSRPPRFNYQQLSDPTRYTITLEPHTRHWLFALDLPASLPIQDIPGGVTLTRTYQLVAHQPIDTRTRYSLSSILQYRLHALSEQERRQALQLPERTNPKTRALARQWRKQTDNDRDLMRHALRYFAKQPFYYTLSPPGLGFNPVDAFLFETRQGFCEHYSTAFVTLMRAAGIPARIVTGYQGGELNELGDYLIIRQRNAHAWAEVWLEKEGWLRVDPTTVIPAQRVNTSLDLNRFRSTAITTSRGQPLSSIGRSLLKLRHSWDAINNSWNQWVLGFDSDRQNRLLQQLGFRSFSWQWLIIVMMVLLFSTLLLIALFILLRQPRHYDPVIHLYQRFCRKLARVGFVRQPAEGPRSFASRVMHFRADLGDPVEKITSLYEALRYKQGTDTTLKKELKKRIAEFRPTSSISPPNIIRNKENDSPLS